MSDSILFQIAESDSILDVGFMDMRAYQGYPSDRERNREPHDTDSTAILTG